MAVCHFCRTEFPNSQSVRAHLRWCDQYRQRNGASSDPALGSDPSRHDEQILPNAPPPLGTQEQTEISPPTGDEVAVQHAPQRHHAAPSGTTLKVLGRRLAEAKIRRELRRLEGEAISLLLVLHDALTALTKLAYDRVWQERMFANCFHHEDEPGLDEWTRLAQAIRRIHANVQSMVTALDADLGTIPTLFLEMQTIRTTWERYRRWRYPGDIPESRAEREETEIAIRRELGAVDNVLGLLKEFLGGDRASN